MTVQRRRAPIRRVGGPLPVEYRSLVAWFYPRSGDGTIHLERWSDQGTDVEDYAITRSWPLGPWSAELDIPMAASAWVATTARMTGWAQLRKLSASDSDDAGDA